ncbi:MAG: TetR-like C-terminal domain-containing protein [Pseudomonadota bacterium]|nr:TetR-like C-terminal domain-containing protein [Pseudomonadota bacterium]
MGRAYVAFAVAHPARWRLIYEHDLADGSAVPESLLRRIDALFALVEERLGEYAPDLHERTLRRTAQALWSGVRGIAVLSITGKLAAGGETPPEILMEDLVRRYLAGLSAEVREE